MAPLLFILHTFLFILSVPMSGANLVLLLPETGELFGTLCSMSEAIQNSRRSRRKGPCSCVGSQKTMSSLKAWPLEKAVSMSVASYSRPKLGAGCLWPALFVLSPGRKALVKSTHLWHIFSLFSMESEILRIQAPFLSRDGWFRGQTRPVERTTKDEMPETLTNPFQEKPGANFVTEAKTWVE